MSTNKITPYTFDKEGFAHHNIIVGYLEKGLEYVTDNEEFRQKIISKAVDKPKSDIEYLYLVYDALGIVAAPAPDMKEQSVLTYLNILSTYDVYRNACLTELEKKVAGIKRKPTKTLEDRKFELQVNEIACSIYTYKDKLSIDEQTVTKHLNENTLNVENLFNSKAVRLMRGADNYPNFAGYIVTPASVKKTGPLVYYISKGALDAYKQAILMRLYDLHANRGDIKGRFLTSSDSVSVKNLLYLVKTVGAGNLINCPKLCRTAVRLDDAQLDDELRQTKSNICTAWMHIVDTMRISRRMSVYDYFSDVYFAGRVDTTTKRMVYGNLDINNTLSVTISTGTFKTSVEYLDKILSERNLKINGTELKSGSSSIWRKLFGSATPKDGNLLNLQESNLEQFRTL